MSEIFTAEKEEFYKERIRGEKQRRVFEMIGDLADEKELYMGYLCSVRRSIEDFEAERKPDYKFRPNSHYFILQAKEQEYHRIVIQLDRKIKLITDVMREPRSDIEK